MNILRKAAVTASSAVLLTAVGAVSGIGLSAAQAYTISASPQVVVVNLTAADAALMATSADEVFRVCSTLDERTTVISFIRPPTALVCAARLSSCAESAAGGPAAVVFYWFSTECHI
jgi:hypothetical protein